MSSKSRSPQALRRSAGAAATTVTARGTNGDRRARTSRCKSMSTPLSTAHAAYRIASHVAIASMPSLVRRKTKRHGRHGQAFDADPCRPSAGPADRGLRVRPARARSPSLLPAQRRGWSRGCRTSATRATRLGRARPYSTAEQRPHSEAHEAPRCRLTRLDIEGEGSCSF
jgi:hypothetical protein